MNNHLQEEIRAMQVQEIFPRHPYLRSRIKLRLSAWMSALLTATLVLGSACMGMAQTAGEAAPLRYTLKQAVATALEKSRDISLAHLQYETSRQEAGLTRSQFLPNLYTGSGVAYTSGFPILAGGGAPALFNLTYNQELFNLPARGDVRADEQKAEQQRLSADAVRDSVIERTVSAYLELSKVRRQLELVRNERQSAQKILDYTRERMQAGYELPIEVTRAQLTAAQVEQRLAQFEDEEETAADQLRFLLGLEPDQPIEVTAETIPPAADQTINDLVAAALRDNPDVKMAESERAASEERLKGERGGYWPTIGLIGQYNLLAKFNNYDQFFNKFQRNNFIAGIDVKIPIFASRTSAAVSFAQANLTASQMQVENKRAQVSLDVRHKARQAREMDTGREVARLELELAQQNLQVLQSQFQQGRASIRDLETAQLDENEKWLAFLDSDIARQKAELDLLHTTGQLAQIFR
jgi:outer membrane protein TolC